MPFAANQIDAFEEMDDYSLFYIIEWLDSIELISVAAASPRVRGMIWNYNLTPEIRASVEISTTDNSLVLEVVEEGEIKSVTLSTNYDDVLDTLRALCPMFAHLDLILDFISQQNNEAVIRVIDYVNDYCSEVPKIMAIKEAKDSIGEFTARNVTSLRLEYPKKLRVSWINDHFPDVEEITVKTDDFFAIREHLPSLKHLELLDNHCDRFNLAAFAEMNPRMGSLKLDRCEGLFNLQQVNEMFPDLVSLHYRPIKYSGFEVLRVPSNIENAVQSVRFRNVTDYTIDVSVLFHKEYDVDVIDNTLARLSLIQFDQLKTLKFVSKGYFLRIDEELSFVSQFVDIINLDYSSRILPYAKALRLVAALPKLKEIAFRPDNYSSNQNWFLQLMTETDLETIHAMVCSSLATRFRAFSLPELWRLHSEKDIVADYKLLTFKRNYQ